MPKTPMKNIGNALALLGALSAGAVSAQEYGTHTLPADLADPAAKVLGVMNKDPRNASRTLGYCEGPAVDAEGNLFFTEDYNGSGNIWKMTPQGVGSNFYNGPAMPNGMEFDPQGRLVVCGLGGVLVFDKNGVRTALGMNPALEAQNRINDLTIASNGAMFFTNHSFGNTYFYRDPTGKVTSYPQNGGLLGVGVPNGIEYIEESKILIVCSSDKSNTVFRFAVADDGKVSNRQTFAKVPVPDGLTLDEKGNVYIASYNDGAIYVFDPTGNNLLGKITVKGNATPEANTSNCVFGGLDGKTLYMTGDAGAFKLQMKVAGRKRPAPTSLNVTGRSERKPSIGKDLLMAFDISGRISAFKPTAIRKSFTLPNQN